MKFESLDDLPCKDHETISKPLSIPVKPSMLLRYRKVSELLKNRKRNVNACARQVLEEMLSDLEKLVADESA